MIDYMRAERHRWSYMNNDQLLARLKRITISREKLDCFIQMADEVGADDLKQAGFDRWSFLFVVRHSLERAPEIAAARESIRNLRPDEREQFVRRSKDMLKKNRSKIIYEPEFRMIR